MLRRLGLATLALVVLLSTPSYAATWTAPEISGDAVTYRFDPEPSPCGTVEQERTTRGDIARLSVRHTRRLLVLTLSVSGLRGVRDVGADFRVRTARKDWSVSVDRFGAPPSVSVGDAYDPDEVEVDECGVVSYSSPVYPCSGDVGTIEARRERISVTIPRRCLGSPGWVRVGAQVYGGRYRSTFSDTWAPRGADDGDPITPVLGPKVHAGRR